MHILFAIFVVFVAQNTYIQSAQIVQEKTPSQIFFEKMQRIRSYQGTIVFQHEHELTISSNEREREMARYDRELKNLFENYIESRHDVNAKDGTYSILWWAVYFNFADIVQSLVICDDLQIDIENCPSTQDTALMLAAKSSTVKIVQTLLSHPRIRVDKQDRWGVTALMRVPSEQHQNESTLTAIIGELVRRGADVNMQDCSGKTVLTQAVKHNYPKVILQLLMLGADPSKAKIPKASLTLYAFAKNRPAFVQAMQDYKYYQQTLDLYIHLTPEIQLPSAIINIILGYAA